MVGRGEVAFELGQRRREFHGKFPRGSRQRRRADRAGDAAAQKEPSRQFGVFREESFGFGHYFFSFNESVTASIAFAPSPSKEVVVKTTVIVYLFDFVLNE